MSTPRGDDRPTTVLPQATRERPAVTTAPATRRARVWQRKLPARLGRARTSTVVIGCLFVLLFASNMVLPTDRYVTVPTEYGDVRVRSSQLTRTPTPPPTSEAPSKAPAGPATTEASETSAPAPTTSAPRTTTDDEETTTPPSRSSVTEDEETTAPTTSAERTTSSRSIPTSAPATTAEPDTPTGTSDPTG